MRSGLNSKYSIYNDEIYKIFLATDQISKRAIARQIINNHNLASQEEDYLKTHICRFLKWKTADKELLQENVRYKKEKQRFQDSNRIQNKTFREYARVENAVEAFGKAIKEQNRLFGTQLSSVKIAPLKRSANKGIGIIHITDAHTNELIDLPHNQYNYHIFSQRLKKYINESLDYFKFRNIGKKVVLVFGGDLLNSDRRLDELLNASTNRAKAVVLTTHILKQAILEIRSQGYEVDIYSVLGNESRAKQEMTFSKEAFSDNYDFTIISQLKEMFEFANIKGINFISIDELEIVIRFPQQNWMIGHNLNKMVDSQKDAQSTIGRYALSGIVVDYMLGGHIHSERTTDYSSRSASLAGSNTYNEHALNLQGRASHKCYVVEGKSRYFQYIDLQYCDNEGYEVISKLEAYNIKSELKLKPNVSIHKVVI